MNHDLDSVSILGRLGVLAAGSLLLWLSATEPRADCSLVKTARIPLPDLGNNRYQGFAGGLYPGVRNSRPAFHEAEGVARARQRIQPLDAEGKPDPVRGRIALISIGMSNTQMEFSRFVDLARLDPAMNPQLVLVNAAQGSRPSTSWTDPDAPAWQTAISRVAAEGITRRQVQVAWIKQAQVGAGPFPAKAQALQADLAAIARNLKLHFPNLQIAYVSSRTRAYTLSGLSPEPTAYETGFAVKWLIEQQLVGTGNLGLQVAPWLSWGPYLWIDGTQPRSDGLVWLCSDTTGDLTHPSSSGRTKVANQLLAFFKTDPTATPWFLAKSISRPQTVQVRVLATASGRTYRVINQGLGRGAVIYVDRSFTFARVPLILAGQTYIQTAFADRSASSDPWLMFEVDQPVTVYVGHDDTVPNPTWLNGFQDSGEDLLAGPVTYSLHRRDFPQGRIVLGPNVSSPQSAVQSMYSVVVVPISGGDIPTLAQGSMPGQETDNLRLQVERMQSGPLRLRVNDAIADDVVLQCSSNLFDWESIDPARSALSTPAEPEFLLDQSLQTAPLFDRAVRTSHVVDTRGFGLGRFCVRRAWS